MIGRFIVNHDFCPTKYESHTDFPPWKATYGAVDETISYTVWVALNRHFDREETVSFFKSLLLLPLFSVLESDTVTLFRMVRWEKLRSQIFIYFWFRGGVGIRVWPFLTNLSVPYGYSCFIPYGYSCFALKYLLWIQLFRIEVSPLDTVVSPSKSQSNLSVMSV